MCASPSTPPLLLPPCPRGRWEPKHARNLLLSYLPARLGYAAGQRELVLIVRQQRGESQPPCSYSFTKKLHFNILKKHFVFFFLKIIPASPF